MSDSRSDRLTAAAGILAAALLVAGFVLVGVDAPSSDATRGEILAAYGNDATSSRQALGVLLAGLGSICLLPFLSHARKLLARTAGESSILPSTALAGGIVLVVSLFAGVVLSASVSAGSYFDAYRVDPDVAMTLVAGGFYLDGFAGMAGGVLIGSTALVAHRGRFLPRWMVVLGFLVAVLSAPAALLGMWIIVDCLWIAIAAGMLAQRSARSTSLAGTGEEHTYRPEPAAAGR